jgi:anti-anti-sigma regulatory factor
VLFQKAPYPFNGIVLAVIRRVVRQMHRELEAFDKLGDAHGSVVIIRLRDRDEVGSTFIRILKRYARSLQQQGNLLMLEGLNERVLEQLQKTDTLSLIGAKNVFLANRRFGLSAVQAYSAAEAWIRSQKPDDDPDARHPVNNKGV